MIFKQKRTVVKNEIDFLNHVNNVVYLQWINDISIAHWLSISNESINSKYIWVAVRHEIDYLKSALLNDAITIKTWIETLKGVKSVRIVEIYKDTLLLAKSKTVWCLLDAKTLKITRIPDIILNMY